MSILAIIKRNKGDGVEGWRQMRTTVQIDEALMARVRRLIPPRGFNQFVNEALAARAHAIERQQLEREMIEGYIATRADREAVATDWEAVDNEGWPA
jgi:Arc/MetJ family transcription regulator